MNAKRIQQQNPTFWATTGATAYACKESITCRVLTRTTDAHILLSLSKTGSPATIEHTARRMLLAAAQSTLVRPRSNSV